MIRAFNEETICQLLKYKKIKALPLNAHDEK